VCIPRGRLKLADPRFCIVVPHYNHHEQFARFLPELLKRGLPVVVVDDGSDMSSYTHLVRLCGECSEVFLFRFPQNRGKGAAVILGADEVRKLGYSHMVQIDADGQHSLADLDALLEASRKNPADLISGLPVYGEDIPAARLHGRKISTWWARVETLSMQILDVMCGFRVYPLRQFFDIADQVRMGSRMQFDPEIMVRMYWAGAEIRYVPVSIEYSHDGLSHFKMFQDNILISMMHARLFLGMLVRVPKLVMRNRAGE
jgi:glycosyltransferase involved in cell wall biosynthesis